MLFRLELSHCQQIAQMIEPVPLRQPGQVSKDLGDETCRFVGTAIARRLAREWSPPPGR